MTRWYPIEYQRTRARRKACHMRRPGLKVAKSQHGICGLQGNQNDFVELEDDMAGERVYKIIELVGTSDSSWEKAAAAAVETAAGSLRDLRIAEISQLDMQIEDGKVQSYRAKIKVSFRYEDKEP